MNIVTILISAAHLEVQHFLEGGAYFNVFEAQRLLEEIRYKQKSRIFQHQYQTSENLSPSFYFMIGFLSSFNLIQYSSDILRYKPQKQ